MTDEVEDVEVEVEVAGRRGLVRVGRKQKTAERLAIEAREKDIVTIKLKYADHVHDPESRDRGGR